MDNVLTGERLEIRYVPVQLVARWERNPKLHDIPQLIKSFEEHGFKDPPKWEPTLNEGAGGIVEGNGRSTALEHAEQSGMEPFRGILFSTSDIEISGKEVPAGAWFMPLLFGVDAKSQAAAEAYGIDHNNLVLSGGGFADIDIAALYDLELYKSVLADLEEEGIPAVSTDLDVLLDELRAAESGFGLPSSAGGASSMGDPEDDDFWPIVRIKMHPETYGRLQSLFGTLPGFEEAIKLDRLLQAVDTTALKDTEVPDYYFDDE